jgi:hypothetical protein
MKKLTLVFLIAGVFAISAYIFVRHSLSTPRFRPSDPKNPAVATKPAESALDLRPRIIEKLQELVKKGSNGLYQLSVHEIEPDLIASTVSIREVLLSPDSAVLRQMQSSGSAPDNVFRISLDAVRIEGIGPQDFLGRDAVDLKTIYITNPTIEIFHSKTATKAKKDSLTLSQRLAGQMKHLAVEKIVLQKGTLILHHLKKNTTTRFRDIAMELSDLLMDPSTQNDKSRFVFANRASFSFENFSMPTSDHLYDVKMGRVSVSTDQGLMTGKNISLQPRFSKTEFQRRVGVMQERYAFSFPFIRFRKMDWWRLLNEESLEAGEAEIRSADLEVYLDRSLPPGKVHMHDFPHQLLMRLPIRVNIPRLKFSNAKLRYEEHNPSSGKTGKVDFSHLNGVITNLTNISSVIRRRNTAQVSATAVFLNRVPMTMGLRFNLAGYKTGAFSASLKVNDFDGTILNPVSEPIAMFLIKRGNVKSLTAATSGDNYKASGKVLLLYDDLHIVPLKKDGDKPGGLKKKSVTSLLANKLLIKDENPKGGHEPRNPDCSFTRDPHGSFFNLVWKTTFVGILKTIGAPEKLAYTK